MPDWRSRAMSSGCNVRSAETGGHRLCAKQSSIALDGASKAFRAPRRVGKIAKPDAARGMPPPHVNMDADEVAVGNSGGEQAGTGFDHPIAAAERALDVRIEAWEPVQDYRRTCCFMKSIAQHRQFAKGDRRSFP